MKKTTFWAASALLAVSAATASASGWRIPEQSIDSLGKSGANIASASHADTAYYNPAKMGFLDSIWQAEMDMNYIHLTPADYDDSRTPLYSHQSEDENFLVPSAFMTSPDFGGFRFGFAVVGSYGLAKHWKNGYGEAFAKKFGLSVFEVNPTASYTIGDMVGVAAGVRVIRASGSVHSDAAIIGRELSRDMNGKTTEFGWNVAVNVRPTKGLDLAATYRSYVDMQFSDTSSLNLMGRRMQLESSISIPAPAVLSLSAAYDVYDDFTVEFVWDRTFWSKYDTFDFNFTPVIPGNPYEKPLERNWKDSDCFRLGMAYRVNDAVELMAGIAYDKSPTPTEMLDFSVPDSNAWLYSLGFRYQMSEQLELGFSVLYDKKEKRDNKVDPTGPIYGSFSNAAAILVTGGVTYSF